jgi:hypothetical protein
MPHPFGIFEHQQARRVDFAGCGERGAATGLAGEGGACGDAGSALLLELRKAATGLMKVRASS